VRAELELERERRAEPSNSDRLIFPATNDPEQVVDIRVVTRWLETAEKLAGLSPVERFGWHSFRRGWATARKDLPAQDVAAVGGWTDIATLQRVYQAADQATMEAVVNGGIRVGAVVR
jgi:integrase